MTISGINLSTINTNVHNDIDIAMLKKSLESIDNSGSNTIKMMEQSVNPNIGSNFDVSV